MAYGDYPTSIGVIINTTCATAGCHDSKSFQAAAGLNLSSWTTLFSGSTSGSPLIPYSSKFSSLCYYINTYTDLGIQNVPTMPLNGKTLSHSDVKLIEDWINAGAPDINGNVKWADNPQRKKLYAVNQGCDIVTVFDSETQLPMRFIPVGRKPISNVPHMIRVSPDGNYWYVIFIYDDVMQKYRCSDDSYVGDVPLTPAAAGTGTGDADYWNSFVITRDGKRAYCASLEQNGKVCCVDLENRKLLHYFTAQYSPHGIVLNAAEDTVYVADQYGNYFTKIDSGFTSDDIIVLLQNGVPQSFYDPSNPQPHDMILSPNNDEIFITCQTSNDVRVYSISLNKITKIIPTGVFPQEIVYSKATGQYFVSCTEDTTSFPGTHGVITRINASDYKPTNIACGFQPHGLAVDESQHLLYVLSRNVLSNGPAPHHTNQCGGRDGFVNFIDLNTFTILPKRYELSADPYFIFARP